MTTQSSSWSNRGWNDGPGGWNDPPGNWGPGTGGTKDRFFRSLTRAMEKKGWRTVHIPGFDWAAIESGHYDLDTLFAAFDADASEMLEGAHVKLGRWADAQGEMPDLRIALAVFERAPRNDIDFITEELQAGNRMGKQSATGVVDLESGELFEPREGSGPAYKRIRINKPVVDQLRQIVKSLAAVYPG